MIEEIEQERQTVGGVDVLEHTDIAGRRTDLIAEIEDEGIVIFEYGSPVQRDQTLLRLDAGQLIVGGQREIAGDRADHQQIVFRQGVQKRDYGMKDHEIRAFNLLYSDCGRVGTLEMRNVLEPLGVPCVPIIHENFILPDTVEELLEIATGSSCIDEDMREGLVFRSRDGAKSFKAVSNEFLMKYHNG